MDAGGGFSDVPPKLSSLSTPDANIIFFTFLTKQLIYSVQLWFLSFFSFSPLLTSAKTTSRTSPLRSNSLSPLPQFLRLIDRLTNALSPRLLISLCSSCTVPQETVIGWNGIRSKWEDGDVNKNLVNNFVTDHSQEPTYIVLGGAKCSPSHKSLLSLHRYYSSIASMIQEHAEHL